MIFRLARFFAWCLLCLSVACATTPTGEGTSDTTTSRKERRSDSPIPRKERILASANAHVELAFSYMVNGDMEAAKEQLQKSRRIARRNPKLDHGYAIYYQRLGQSKRSEDHFVSALEQAPNDPSINNNYGVLLSELGRYNEAYRKFQAAYSNLDYSYRYSAYENYGDVARLNGDDDRALKAYQQALALNPDWFILHIKVARSYYNRAEFLPAYEHLRTYMTKVQALNLSPSREDLELGIALASAIKDYEMVDNYQEWLQQLQ